MSDFINISSKFHPKSTKMEARSASRAILEASRFQERINDHRLMLFFGLLTPLGRFWAPFWAPADPERGAKIALFRKNQHKMRKNEVQEGIAEKLDFCIDF